MTRVSPTNKCGICGHGSWCLIGRSVIICMRVASDKVKNFKGGEVGYIHPHPDPTHRPVYELSPTKKESHINAKRVLQDWIKAYALEQSRLPYLANDLGVSVESLKALGCQAGGNKRAWGFPMFDGYGNMIGIRMRNEWGNKWAVTGSQSGIFVPGLKPQRRMLVVEGPTDTAAALSMGYYCIGRPSCSGGVPHILAHVRRCHITEAVIVADNDDPGIRGACDLQRWLEIRSCVLVLPTKDLREFSRIADKSAIDAMIEQQVWTEPRKTT